MILRWFSSLVLIVTLFLGTRAYADESCLRSEVICPHTDDLVLEADVISVDHDSVPGATLVTLAPINVIRGSTRTSTVNFLMALTVKKQVDNETGVTTMKIGGSPGTMFLTPGERVLAFLRTSDQTDGVWANQLYTSTIGHSLFRMHSATGQKHVALSQSGKLVAEANCDKPLDTTESRGIAPIGQVAPWEYAPYVDQAISWETFVRSLQTCAQERHIEAFCNQAVPPQAIPKELLPGSLL